MQVFVRTSELIEDPVMVYGFYPDDQVLPVDAHGVGMTLLVLPANAVDTSVTPPRLVTNFRNNMPMMVNAEASRRIRVAFSEFMQRNCNADITTSQTRYGADSTAWPVDAQNRLAENDRGWHYVAQIRQTADALENQTTLNDPTDDSHWPVEITPVYIEPVP